MSVREIVGLVLVFERVGASFLGVKCREVAWYAELREENKNDEMMNHAKLHRDDDVKNDTMLLLLPCYRNRFFSLRYFTDHSLWNSIDSGALDFRGNSC